MLSAAATNNVDAMAKLLDAGFDINSQDPVRSDCDLFLLHFTNLLHYSNVFILTSDRDHAANGGYPEQKCSNGGISVVKRG